MFYNINIIYAHPKYTDLVANLPILISIYLYNIITHGVYLLFIIIIIEFSRYINILVIESHAGYYSFRNHNNMRIAWYMFILIESITFAFIIISNLYINMHYWILFNYYNSFMYTYAFANMIVLTSSSIPSNVALGSLLIGNNIINIYINMSFIIGNGLVFWAFTGKELYNIKLNMNDGALGSIF